MQSVLDRRHVDHRGNDRDLYVPHCLPFLLLFLVLVFPFQFPLHVPLLPLLDWDPLDEEQRDFLPLQYPAHFMS